MPARAKKSPRQVKRPVTRSRSHAPLAGPRKRVAAFRASFAGSRQPVRESIGDRTSRTKWFRVPAFGLAGRHRPTFSDYEELPAGAGHCAVSGGFGLLIDGGFSDIA